MKYKFWVKSSRQTNIERVFEISDSYTEEDIEYLLIEWCEKVFPMFHFTDAFVNYGFDKVQSKYLYSDNVE
jgi:hypothetical protein